MGKRLVTATGSLGVLPVWSGQVEMARSRTEDAIDALADIAAAIVMQAAMGACCHAG
jgi:hypothetical protein